MFIPHRVDFASATFVGFRLALSDEPNNAIDIMTSDWDRSVITALMVQNHPLWVLSCMAQGRWNRNTIGLPLILQIHIILTFDFLEFIHTCRRYESEPAHAAFHYLDLNTGEMLPHIGIQRCDLHKSKPLRNQLPSSIHLGCWRPPGGSLSLQPWLVFDDKGWDEANLIGPEVFV